jgi:hypothetical protein
MTQNEIINIENAILTNIRLCKLTIKSNTGLGKPEYMMPFKDSEK